MIISVENSDFTREKINDDVLLLLKNKVEEKIKADCELNNKISVLFKIDSYNFKEGKKTKISIISKIKDSSYTERRESGNSNEVMASTMNELLSEFIKKERCSHPKIVNQTYNERVFPDGRAICNACGLKFEGFFEKDNNSKYKILTGSFGNSEYLTKYDWGGVSLQFGDKGVVLGKNPYTTAFFEAFPTISGYGTFIRGEGKTAEDAENSCWLKFIKMKECLSHEFSREIKGHHRKDGAGQCVKCGLFSSNALPPETKCKECNKPTKLTFKDVFYCWNHYILLEESDVVNDVINESDGLFSYEDINEQKLDNFIEFNFWKFMVTERGSFFV